LSAGYASVPPFTGFIAWLVIHTLGYSELAIRIIPAVLSGVLVIIVACAAKEMGGGNFSQIIAAITLFVTAFNLRVFALFMPVCFDAVFWSLIFLIILKWMNTKEDKYLLIFGLFIGIAMLNKYLVVLEIFGLMLALFFSPYRIIFTKRSFWFSVGIALVIFLPNLIWQIKNEMPVFIHMRVLREHQLNYVNRLNFLTDQFSLILMGTVLVIPGILYLGFSSKMKPFQPLVVTAFIVLVMLIILKGKSYYTIGLFPLLIAAGGVYWESKLYKMYSRILLSLALLLITVPVLPLGIPVFKPGKLVGYCDYIKNKLGIDNYLRWESGQIHSLPQDYADMLGWDELASITAKAYNQVQDKRSAMIYASNYGEAGAVMVLGKTYNLPEPVCFSESFFYWLPRNPAYEIKSLIYINDHLGDDIHDLFTDCTQVGQIENPLSREYGTQVWLCTNPRNSFNAFWKEKLSQITNPFQY